jgi:hypothetical protein
MASHEYSTTQGNLVWDDEAYSVEYADDPKPPEGDGWVMCGSVIGELRQFRQPILWFWTREVN